ncbi:MAG TPA: ABC transporter ATP-binding protein [candidate division Zixibacteria bacterium]|nr:ABC transporter ATP-binding protein [candidate division Zixibacteria bacterium]
MNQIPEPLLSAESVAHTFPDGVMAISDISLTINRGSYVSLVGPSGVGKSTLLRIIGGILKPSEGEIHLKGAGSLREGDPIGIVFQRDNLMPWRTVTDNIRLPLELRNDYANDGRGETVEMIELVGLSGFENSYPAQLSGGMAQRVAIARALIHRPSLLLLDEPFGSLDAITRERMGQELLRIWHAMPVTVFMVTHSIPEAVLLSDEVLVMTGQPGTLTAHFPISLPRPRQVDMQLSAEFQAYASQVRSAIGQGQRIQ